MEKKTGFFRRIADTFAEVFGGTTGLLTGSVSMMAIMAIGIAGLTEAYAGINTALAALLGPNTAGLGAAKLLVGTTLLLIFRLLFSLVSFSETAEQVDGILFRRRPRSREKIADKPMPAPAEAPKKAAQPATPQPAQAKAHSAELDYLTMADVPLELFKNVSKTWQDGTLILSWPGLRITMHNLQQHSKEFAKRTATCRPGFVEWAYKNALCDIRKDASGNLLLTLTHAPPYRHQQTGRNTGLVTVGPASQLRSLGLLRVYGKAGEVGLAITEY